MIRCSESSGGREQQRKEGISIGDAEGGTQEQRMPPDGGDGMMRGDSCDDDEGVMEQMADGGGSLEGGSQMKCENESKEGGVNGRGEQEREVMMMMVRERLVGIWVGMMMDVEGGLAVMMMES